MQADSYHALAKDAGNKLKNYVLGYASGATGVFFLALADTNGTYTTWQKALLVLAILFFVATIVISLYELHVDARRFFNVAKQLERAEQEQNWELNNHYKALRVKLIYTSYVTVALATALSVSFLVARVA